MGIYFRTPEQESPSFKRPHLIASLNYRRVRSTDILWQKHLFARFSLYFSYLTLSWSLLSRDKVCLVHNTIQDLQHSTFTLITHCTGLPCSNPIPSPTTSHATVARVDLKNTQLNACLPSLPSHCRSIVRSLVGTNLTTRAFVLGALLFSIYRQSLSFRTPSILFSLTAWHLKKKIPRWMMEGAIPRYVQCFLHLTYTHLFELLNERILSQYYAWSTLTFSRKLKILWHTGLLLRQYLIMFRCIC